MGFGSSPSGRSALAAGLFLVALGPLRARAQEADPWWGPDKALHFGLSAAIAGGGYGVGALVFEEAWKRPVSGASLALAAGVGKELFDLAGHGHASWKDLTWDVIGAATGLLVAWGIDLLWTHLFGANPASTHAAVSSPRLR